MLRSALPGMTLLLCTFHSLHSTAATSLLASVKAHTVSMEAIKNSATYHGYGLDLHLKNNTNKDMTISIDPAMIFIATDTDEQDLVIIHDEAVVLKANGEQTVTVLCFCAKSYGAPPKQSMVYNYKKQGNDIMVQVLRYIDVNHVNSNVAQDAVWVLTNNHPLSDVYPNDAASAGLVSLMSRLLHRPMPELYVYHMQNDTATHVVYNPKPLKMMAKFEYIATEDQILTLGVYNDSGVNVESVFDNKPFGKGGHRFTVEFQAADVPAGNYFIRLIREGKVLKQQAVKIE